MSYSDIEMLTNFIKKVVKQEMKKTENYIPFLLPGVIASVDGSFANVYINDQSTVTPNIPINPSISVSEDDHVWVLKVNFRDVDLLVLSKRVIS